MTADEIRALEAGRWGHAYMQEVLLQELTAQLADLNARLATWSWPDGTGGVIKK